MKLSWTCCHKPQQIVCRYIFDFLFADVDGSSPRTEEGSRPWLKVLCIHISPTQWRGGDYQMSQQRKVICGPFYTSWLLACSKFSIYFFLILFYSFICLFIYLFIYLFICLLTSFLIIYFIYLFLFYLFNIIRCIN